MGDKMYPGKFKTCANKGFHITFNNGVTFSVKFGAGNYCNDYPIPMDENFEKRFQSKDDHESPTLKLRYGMKKGKKNG